MTKNARARIIQALKDLAVVKIPGTSISKFHEIETIADCAGVSRSTARKHCDHLSRCQGYQAHRSGRAGRVRFRYIGDWPN